MPALVPRVARLRSTAVLVALVSLAGCAGSTSSGSPAAGSPAASPGAGGGADRTVVITMTDAGCRPTPSTITAGPVTFRIVNQDSMKSSEAELVQGDRILGEKENLTPGLTGSFSLEVGAGAYEVYCPGAVTERSPFTVTAVASSVEPSGAGSSPSPAAELTAALRAATIGYAPYVRPLNGYIRHTGSAVFACPPGPGPSGWWGEKLLG